MIVGFSITHLEAEKEESKGRNANINFSHRFTDVEEADVPAIDETVARIHFELDINYEHEEERVAHMAFKGTVLWQGDADAVIEQWNEDEQMAQGVHTTVTNYAFRKCVSQAVSLADSLSIQAPVPMPAVQHRKPQGQ